MGDGDLHERAMDGAADDGWPTRGDEMRSNGRARETMPLHHFLPCSGEISWN
jgi:hypothetical protein